MRVKMEMPNNGASLGIEIMRNVTLTNRKQAQRQPHIQTNNYVSEFAKDFKISSNSSRGWLEEFTYSKSITSKLHLLFQKNLAGSLKTLKVTRISAMYTNFLHPPSHSGPSKISRPKIWNWSLGHTKANKNLFND